MSFTMKVTLVIILAILALALAIILPFSSNPSDDLLPKFALSQLAFSSVAFFAVFLALYFTMVQLRKSMAKPKIKVAFNEKGEQQAILTYRDSNPLGLPDLWLINEGNSISRYFQIDFIIPENIGKQSNIGSINCIQKDDGNFYIQYLNDGIYTLFVNRPYRETKILLLAALDTKKCMEVPKDSFEIKYWIYGDWAETQEGKLRVNINKQQEVA